MGIALRHLGYLQIQAVLKGHSHILHSLLDNLGKFGWLQRIH